MSTDFSFPPEVWSLTLHNLRDLKSQDELTYLWTTVRHVCRQFMTEVESIFRTQHLPKTFIHIHRHTVAPEWIYNGDDWSVSSMDHQMLPESSCRFDFDSVNSLCVERAVFLIRSINISLEEVNAILLKGVEAKGKPGNLDEGDASKVARPEPLFENTVGRTLIQIRGGLHDCTLPSLIVEQEEDALSFEWKDLFTRYFGDKKRILENEPVSDVKIITLPPSKEECHAYYCRTLPPALKDLAQRDFEVLKIHWTEYQARRTRIECMRNPVHTWTAITECTSAGPRMSVAGCRLRRRADQATNINEEGFVSVANMEVEIQAARDRTAVMKDDNLHRVMACDACRELGIECKKPDPVHVPDEDDPLRTPVSFLGISHLLRFYERRCVNCATAECEITLVHLHLGTLKCLPDCDGGPDKYHGRTRTRLWPSHATAECPPRSLQLE
jgi:hypothetical protein